MLTTPLKPLSGVIARINLARSCQVRAWVSWEAGSFKMFENHDIGLLSGTHYSGKIMLTDAASKNFSEIEAASSLPTAHI